MKPWSLSRRLTALCAAAASVLALIAIVAALAAFANRSDVDRVLNHIGPASQNSEQLLSDLLPSFDGWNNDGDRNIVCVFVFPQQGAVTGSVVDQAEAGTIKPGEPPPVVAVPPTFEGGS